jgi:hypothetical protein
MFMHRLGMGTLALLFVATAVAPAAAQDRITLRYHPEIRGQVPTRSWTEIEGKLAMGGMVEMMIAMAEGFAEAVGADTGEVSVRDSLEAEAEAAGMDQDSVSMHLQLVQTVTERLVVADESSVRVRRIIVTDSARAREEGGEWEDQEPGTFPLTSADLVLDDRMNVLEFDMARGEEQPMLEGMLRGPTGFEVVFPEEPVEVGSSWTVDTRLPFGATGDLTGGQVPIEEPEIVAHARYTLDSLVVRAADTLAFLSVVGVLEPAEASETEEGLTGTASIEGNFGGYLIWSTAWSAFVSGSSRLRMVLDMQFEGEEELGDVTLGFGMRLDLRNRFRVQP